MMIRWISFSLFGAILSYLSLGCASTLPLETKLAEVTAQNERLAKQVSVMQAERHAQGNGTQALPADPPRASDPVPTAAPSAPAPVQMMQPVLMQPHYGAGCAQGYDVLVDNTNHSGEAVELQGDNIVPCSLNGIAQVQTSDGRMIFLVQDGSQARFAYLGRGAFTIRLVGYDRLLWDSVGQRYVATPNKRAKLFSFAGASTGRTGTWLINVMSGDLS